MSDQKLATPATDKNSVGPELTEEDKLKNQLRGLTTDQIEKLTAPKPRPLQVKRKTLHDYINRDSSAVHMLQVASASYDAELNLYNRNFQVGDYV